MPYFLASLLLIAGVAWGGARIECAAPAHDFGAVGGTGIVSHVFLIANAGDATLKIDWTRVCCGATAEWATNTVAVGTNTALRVTLALEGKLGQVERAIYVMSNDPVTPVFRLTLTATTPVRRREQTDGLTGKRSQ